MQQDHYPETLFRMFIVNAPKVFSVAWSFVKPMLDVKTLDKIQIYGADYYPALVQLMDEAVIPSFLGGRCNCPGGCLNSELGPWQDRRIMEVEDIRSAVVVVVEVFHKDLWTTLTSTVSGHTCQLWSVIF